MAAKMEVKQAASETTRRQPFALTLVFSVVLFLILTALALRQSPRPYPLSEATGWQSFAYPREHNALLRLPLFSGAINDFFVLPNSNLAWAVGEGGLILHSEDGGETWQRQTLASAQVNSAQAAPAAAGLPTIFTRAHAAEAPVSKRTVPTPPSNLSISGTKDVPPDTYEEQQAQQQIEPDNALPAQEPEPVQKEEEPAATPDVGAPLPDFYSVWFLDESVGVVAGASGSVYRTEDGGDSWQQVATAVSGALDNLYFDPGSERLFASSGAQVVVSDDLGLSWTPGPLTRLIVEPLIGFYGSKIAESNRQFAVQVVALGERGSTYAVAADGRIAAPQKRFAYGSGLLRSLGGAGDTVYAVGDQGVVFDVLSSDIPAQQKYLPGDANLRAITGNEAGRLLVASDQGSAYRSDDRGDSWQTLPVLGKTRFRSLAAVHDDVLLAAGADGVIQRSEDGGQSWHYTLAGETVLADYYQQQNPGAQLRIDGGLVQVAAAGSENWQTLEYARTPAIWYWLVCVYFALVALGIANRKRLVQEGSAETVADVLASDRPLRPGDPDPLEFGAIARGLSRFMRNPKTEPPLTVAITGAWGTGKSSLMNLLHHDLQSYGFTPVWFNAWHHQKGEQLLASLYANIRSQAVPNWFAWSRGVPVGLLFRINLLFRRSAKNRIFTVLLILIFTAALVYLGRESGGNYGGWLGEKIVQMSRAGDLESLLVVLFGNLAPVVAALRALRAFGLNPQSLMALGGEEGGGRKRVDPGARQQFAREFSDVSSSLELGRMVIFIDDLDRCRQENVVDILEAVNFLAVSGNCYIVIGMDEKWVRVCIEQQFEQMISNGQSGHAFSENYLEKLINIKVPVPTLEADSSSRLLTPENPPAQDASTLAELGGWLQLQWQRYRYLLLMLSYAGLGILLGMIVAHWDTWVGKDLLPATPVAPTVAVQQWDNVTLEPRELDGGKQGFVINLQSQADPDQKSKFPQLQLRLQARADQLADGVRLAQLGGAEGNLDLVLRQIQAQDADGASTAAEAETAATTPDRASLSARRYIGGEPGRFQRNEVVLASALLLLLLTSILFYLFKRQQRIVSDSPVFREALNLWHPWIMINRQTPRAIKRYLNRVRYIAMRYREEDAGAEQSFWQRLWQSRRADSEAVKLDERFIDEAQLVALSAIYSVDESWLGDAEKFELLNQGKLTVLLDKKFEPRKIGIDLDTTNWQELATRLQQVLDKHREQFGEGIPDQQARIKFLRVVTATEFA